MKRRLATGRVWRLPVLWDCKPEPAPVATATVVHCITDVLPHQRDVIETGMRQVGAGEERLWDFSARPPTRR